jgi:hypothetical protein
MIACAQAQEAPAPAQGDPHPASSKPAQKPSDAKKPAATNQAKKTDQKADEKADATDDTEQKQLLNSITLSYLSWNSSRNINTINQNGFVNGGFGLADLSLLVPYEKERFYAFDLKGNPGDDFGVRLISQWGVGTSVTTTAHQFSWFDPSYGNQFPSRDKDFTTTVDQQLAPNFGAFATVDFSEKVNQFPAPLYQPDSVTRVVALGTQKQIGNSNIGATVSESSYTDHSGVQPNSQTDRGELRYSQSFGPRLTAQGSLAVSSIQVAGQPTSWITNYKASGVFDINDVSSFGAHYDQMNLDLNSVQNAYVKRKMDSGVTYDTMLGHWSTAIGYDHREEERLRTDQSYVDVPEWNAYNFKLNGRVFKTDRFGLKASLEDLSSAPIFQTDDPALLYWSRKAAVEAKLSGGNEVNSGYLSCNYRYRNNIDRQFNLNWTNVALGGSRVFSPKLLAYAEFASDQYSVGGQSSEATALGNYFPTSETFMFGADYTRNSRENFSFVMTSFYTQDQWGQQIALTYHLDLGKDRNFQITYSPWLQRDRLYDVDTFTAPILQVKIGTRF